MSHMRQQQKSTDLMLVIAALGFGAIYGEAQCGRLSSSCQGAFALTLDRCDPY